MRTDLIWTDSLENLRRTKKEAVSKGAAFLVFFHHDQAVATYRDPKSGTNIGFDYQSGSIETLKRLVRNGVGYTLVPELSVV